MASSLSRFSAVQAAIYAFAFFFPPAVSLVLTTVTSVSQVMVHQNPKPISPVAQPAITHGMVQPQVQPSTPSSGLPKLKVVVMLSNAGTEIMDFLGPVEILGATHRFDITLAAPLKQLSPTTGPLAVLPDRAFSEIPDSEPVDLLVIPAMLDSTNSALTEWIAKRSPRAKMVLVCGEGARSAGVAGILRGKNVTTDFSAFEELAANFPGSTWVRHKRYLQDGNLITTAGIAASLDGTFAAVESLFGFPVARDAAKFLQYSWNHASVTQGQTIDVKTRLNEWVPESLKPKDYLTLLGGAYRWSRDAVAVLLYPGVSEIGVAAPIEAFSRTLATRTFTVAPERRPIRTRFGVTLVPQEPIGESEHPDILIVPSGRNADDRPPVANPLPEDITRRWVRDQNIAVKSSLYSYSGSALTETLTWVGQTEGMPLTATVAKLMEMPDPFEVPPEEDSLPKSFWVKLFGLGATGLVIASILMRKYMRTA